MLASISTIVNLVYNISLQQNNLIVNLVDNLGGVLYSSVKDIIRGEWLGFRIKKYGFN